MDKWTYQKLTCGNLDDEALPNSHLSWRFNDYVLVYVALPVVQTIDVADDMTLPTVINIFVVVDVAM